MTETVLSGNSQQTTNSTHPSGGGGGRLCWNKINTQYFTTIPGIIKLVQIIMGIVCIVGGYFFDIWIAIAFLLTVIWSALYLLGDREGKLSTVNWILTELIQTGFSAFFYFVSFIVQMIFLNLVAALFVALNCLAYVGGTYFLYVEYRERGSGLEPKRVPPTQVISI